MLGASGGAFLTYIRFKNLARQEPETRESTPVKPKVHCGMKALIVGHDPEMIGIFSALFHEKNIEAGKCFIESAALDRLSSDKFEAIVLDFDEITECPSILRNLPRPNERLVVIAVASDHNKKESAARAGAMFVVERPVTPSEIRKVLGVAYGRMLREGQRYFRLGIELPVSVQTSSGTVRQCTTLNLSQTGMAVKSLSSFIVGEPIQIIFVVPNTDISVSAAGKIIWDDKHGKTGINFECADELTQSRYHEWLHDHFFMQTGPNCRTSDQEVYAQ